MKFRLNLEHLDSRDLPSASPYLPPVDPPPAYSPPAVSYDPSMVLPGYTPSSYTPPMPGAPDASAPPNAPPTSNPAAPPIAGPPDVNASPDPAPNPAPVENQQADPFKAEIDRLNTLDMSLQALSIKFEAERQLWTDKKAVQKVAVAAEQQAFDAADTQLLNATLALTTYKQKNENPPAPFVQPADYATEVERLQKAIADAKTDVVGASNSLARQKALLANIDQRINYIDGLIAQIDGQRKQIRERIGKLVLDQKNSVAYDGKPLNLIQVPPSPMTGTIWTDHTQSLDASIYPLSSIPPIK